MILPDHQQGILSLALQQPTAHFSTAGGISSYMGNGDEVETSKKMNNKEPFRAFGAATRGLWSRSKQQLGSNVTSLSFLIMHFHVFLMK